MEYLIFNKKNFNPGELTMHLNRLQKFGGTPDFWNSANTLESAIAEAKKIESALITDEDYNILIHDVKKG